MDDLKNTIFWLKSIYTENRVWLHGRRKEIATAIDGLEELQQYRAIGTVEECSAAIEKESYWIPFTERKPTENGEYIVQFDGDNVKIGEWRNDNFVVDCWMIDKSRIVAWMEKPMPMKEG